MYTEYLLPLFLPINLEPSSETSRMIIGPSRLMDDGSTSMWEVVRGLNNYFNHGLAQWTLKRRLAG